MDPELEKYLFDGKRFKEVYGYKFDKLIFGVYILLILGLFLISFIAFGSDKSEHIYYKCNADHGSFQCYHPFYMNYPICESAWPGACVDETVPAGFTFGSPAPMIVSAWGWIVGILLFCAFVINHFLYNKGFKRIDTHE